MNGGLEGMVVGIHGYMADVDAAVTVEVVAVDAAFVIADSGGMIRVDVLLPIANVIFFFTITDTVSVTTIIVEI